MKQQLEASILLKDHPKYDDELKQIADSYFEAMQLLLGEYSQHMYIQGAKDCVTVLFSTDCFMGIGQSLMGQGLRHIRFLQKQKKRPQKRA
ncbi:hypothetical protein [Sedimentibacter hydroxybenzoicus]|uniref:hypothetical protein n=1 Tax=Sedimentibacter hydroxybenzoicus TaxID=29345 RepID=UPI001FE428E6|nr:hypothetical protein [Sedimentibacter hydroxybenzoicus]